MMPGLRAPRERYPALTGVRAAGASAVFFDHFPLWPDQHIILNVMAFFFVLSGFLITRLYHEQAQLQRGWLAGYLANRFARIYPVYWLVLTVAVCLQQELHPWVLVKNYTLTHALFYHTPMMIEPTWTLTVEECFYVLAPVFMIVARRYTFGGVLLLGWLILAAALVISKLGITFLHTPLFVLSTTFPGHFLEFFAGVYLALVITRLERAGAASVPGQWRTLGGLAGVGLLGLAMVMVYRRAVFHPLLIILINNFLIPGPIVLLYSGLIRERSVVASFLSAEFVRLLGRSSYSFYVMHVLVIHYLAGPLAQAGGPGRALCIGVAFVATWAVAILLFRLYEEPCNVWIRRKLRVRSLLAPQAEPSTLGRLA